jgi:hypothetical protein
MVPVSLFGEGRAENARELTGPLLFRRALGRGKGRIFRVRVFLFQVCRGRVRAVIEQSVQLCHQAGESVAVLLFRNQVAQFFHSLFRLFIQHPCHGLLSPERVCRRNRERRAPGRASAGVPVQRLFELRAYAVPLLVMISCRHQRAQLLDSMLYLPGHESESALHQNCRGYRERRIPNATDSPVGKTTYARASESLACKTGGDVGNRCRGN